MDFDKYKDIRKKGKGLYGYGLNRRLLQISNLIHSIMKSSYGFKMNIVDFGCADEITLEFLFAQYNDNIDKSVGVDIFYHGMPDAEDNDSRMIFRKINLFKDYPYPFPDRNFNIAICSAFFKHHPNPKKFLSEVYRILDNNGYLILIDPCPWVMKAGMFFKYFDKKYCTNQWNGRALKLHSDDKNLYHFERIAYERYWIAPNNSIYKLGIEKIIPYKLMQIIGLHQSMLLKKI